MFHWPSVGQSTGQNWGVCNKRIEDKEEEDDEEVPKTAGSFPGTSVPPPPRSLPTSFHPGSSHPE